MRHDWVFDVLSDLHAYACRNDLPRLAENVALALIEAKAEIAAPGDTALRPAVTLRANRRVRQPNSVPERPG